MRKERRLLLLQNQETSFHKAPCVIFAPLDHGQGRENVSPQLTIQPVIALTIDTHCSSATASAISSKSHSFCSAQPNAGQDEARSPLPHAEVNGSAESASSQDEDAILLAALEQVERERAAAANRQAVSSSSALHPSLQAAAAFPLSPCQPGSLPPSPWPLAQALPAAAQTSGGGDDGSAAAESAAAPCVETRGGVSEPEPPAPPPYAADLNAAQRRAALHDIDGPLLVLAGALTADKSRFLRSRSPLCTHTHTSIRPHTRLASPVPSCRPPTASQVRRAASGTPGRQPARHTARPCPDASSTALRAPVQRERRVQAYGAIRVARCCGSRRPKPPPPWSSLMLARAGSCPRPFRPADGGGERRQDVHQSLLTPSICLSVCRSIPAYMHACTLVCTKAG